MAVVTLFLIALLARLGMQLALDWANWRHLRRHGGVLPERLRGVVEPETFRRSTDYTEAKLRLGLVETLADTVVLAVVLLSGLLPWLHGAFAGWLGETVWVSGLFLFGVLLLLSLASLPFDWYGQFRLEERFGFNRTTPGLWVGDKVKGALVGFVIGYPLVVLLMKLVGWLGAWWWLWGFAIFFVFQLLMVVLYPMFIMPLFNKFTPLPEGELRDRLMALAERTGFRTRAILVMDGSRRSTHANAFFTGFGRFRRIVLFDTLVEQLTAEELEAVLAHEIGHYKLGHIPRTLAVSALVVLGAFWLIDRLLQSPWFFEGFGFGSPDIGVALLLFLLLGGLVGFWLSPLFNRLSRRHEYQADAFAAEAVGAVSPLKSALRKLSEKNLSNLVPHPFYSGFYYSHPTLLERESALDRSGPPAAAGEA
ncbi:MAG: M48 family peptidase [Puniceicoccaceae bacterium]|nr:MAG: M48 family peptidase [Puniceicoccaceae bacterium]